jgi:hypothetical protein
MALNKKETKAMPCYSFDLTLNIDIKKGTKV